MRSVETVLGLVVLATVVATFARRLSVPAPSLLVVAGVIAGLIPGIPAIEVTPEAISLVVLPPLLFASGEELPWRDLRAVWKPVAVLAVGLVMVSAFVVGAVAVLLTPLPVGMAFMLGALLSATDPVAVTALGRRLSLPSRVQTLVQAESLFNDATSLLLFKVAMSLVVAGGSLTIAHTATEFALLAGGGTLVGVLVAAAAFVVRIRTEDPILESVISLVTPYGAYILAEATGGSGVTAVVVASVILGTQARRLTNARIRLQLNAINGTVVFVLESMVFGIIGLQLPALIRGHPLSEWLLPALAIAAVMVLVRVLWVFPLSAIQQRRHLVEVAVPGARGMRWQVPAVVSWAGARGVVPLAAALSIPLTTSNGELLPNRDIIMLLTTCVIVLTLVVQGFTLAPLVRRAGIAMSDDDVRQEHTSARVLMTRAALDHLEQVSDLETEPEYVIEQLRSSWQRRLERFEVDDSEDASNSSTPIDYRRLRRDLLAVEGAELTRLFEEGEITESTRRRIQQLLDLEHTGLGD